MSARYYLFAPGYFFAISVAAFFFPPYVGQAATLYFEPRDAEILRGDTKTVAVRIDTDEGECINAVSAEIFYDGGIQAVDVSRGNSILSLWVEDPVIDQKSGTISFAGGIPNGYCGRVDGDPRLTNVIAEIVFQAPGFTVGGSKSDESRIRFSDTTEVLLHDGKGSVATLSVFDTALKLSDEVGAAGVDVWRERVASDVTPPEDFSITLTQDETAFSGRHYIVFNTTDKQSGIDHYEVIEEPFDMFELFNWGATDAPWVEARSPYILTDQTLNSTIRVRAFDKAGNEYIATLVPDETLRSNPNQLYLFAAIAVALLVLLGAIMTVIIFRRRAQKQPEDL